MATANVIGGTADGRLYRTIAVAGHAWSECATAAVSVSTVTAQSDMGVTRRKLTNWDLGRAYLIFDVTPWQAGGAHAGSTITAVTLNFTAVPYGYCVAGYFYYNNWGATLAAGDWGDKAHAASAEFSHARNGASDHVISVALTNLSDLLTYNGGIEWALTDETTEPTGATVNSELYYADNTTAAKRPNIDITYMFVVAEAGAANLTITAAGSIDVAAAGAAQTEAGDATLVVTAAGAEILTLPESGAAGLSVAANGAIGIAKASSVSILLDIAAEGTVGGVVESEAGAAGFAVTASGTIGVSDLVATEAGAAGFTISATGTEAVTKPEAGVAGLNITATGTGNATRPEAGAGTFSVTASGSIGVVHYVASAVGSATLGVTAQGAITTSTLALSGTANVNVNATGAIEAGKFLSGTAGFHVNATGGIRTWSPNVDFSAHVLARGWGAEVEDEGWSAHTERPGMTATIERPV
jgi:hypothetical protein